MSRCAHAFAFVLCVAHAACLSTGQVALTMHPLRRWQAKAKRSLNVAGHALRTSAI